MAATHLGALLAALGLLLSGFFYDLDVLQSADSDGPYAADCGSPAGAQCLAYHETRY